MNQSLKVAVIGGGAAGFFSALSVKHHHPDAEVVILEKTSKLLSKVLVSGGGRCNVTNGCHEIPELLKAYPRGSQLLKQALRQFSTTDTMNWFEQRSVKLKTEADGRVFPITDNSQTIAECLLNEASKLRIRIQIKTSVNAINQDAQGFNLDLSNETIHVNKVIIATGGSPKLEGLQWLADIGHEIETPVPSLFTFNMPINPVTELMGVVCKSAVASVQGTKLKSSGPLLITHWGMSGPAILKLSAFAARHLADCNYEFTAQINWADGKNDPEVQQALNGIILSNPQKLITNLKPFDLPDRLWQYLLQKAEISSERKWSEIGKKGLNKLTAVLTNDLYPVKGKTTFKAEFVTCGGVSLSSIKKETMESKVQSGMYFAGEVMDIDGITGGYNFQAAWTTGWIAGQLA